MQLHHVGVEVTDLKRSVRYYRRMGFQEEAQMQIGEEIIVFLVNGGTRLELVESDPSLDGESMIHLAFLAEKEDQWQAIGAEEASRLNWTNGWQSLFFEGPDGEEWEMILTGVEGEP